MLAMTCDSPVIQLAGQVIITALEWIEKQFEPATRTKLQTFDEYRLLLWSLR